MVPTYSVLNIDLRFVTFLNLVGMGTKWTLGVIELIALEWVNLGM